MDTVAQRPAPHRVSLALPGVSLELGGEGEEEEKKKQEGGRQREGGREIWRELFPQALALEWVSLSWIFGYCIPRPALDPLSIAGDTQELPFCRSVLPAEKVV